MKPRVSSDYRTLLWAFGLFPTLILVAYGNPHVLAWTAPCALYMGFCAGIFAHNHNHCPTFSNRTANEAFGIWISVLYGYPIFAWIPTHNLNHHQFMNRAGDATITWRYSTRNTWVAASSYFFVSAYWQQPLIRAFVAKARASSPHLYARIRRQSVSFYAAHIAFFAIAALLHGWLLGAMVYAGTFGASVAAGLWGMMFMNFIQHVDCDPWSEHNHSRDFVSKWENFLVFNSGFHTAHHAHPGCHWSRLPDVHARVSGRIHPDLCQPSVLWFCVRSYLLGALLPAFRTRQVGRPAYAQLP